jgi:dipeptidase D
MSKNPLAGKKPEAVWRYFKEISDIPRCSGSEGPVIEYVKQFAEAHKLTWKCDKVGNIIVKKGASPGKEGHPGVVLQGHLDMVCEKNRGTDHDFSCDPIKLVVDGDWLKADGTTLGADNGIAIAMALAALESNELNHGPMEALFTIDEESGLTGAMELDPSIIDGRILLNIDSEELGAFYIGCAGGVHTEGFIPVETEEIPQSSAVLSLSVTGFRGGHSGAEIHLGLGNAIVTTGRLLWELAQEMELHLISIEGGGKHNAIPRECLTHLTVPAEKKKEALMLAENLAARVKEEMGDIEPDFSLSCSESGREEERFSLESTNRIIRLLRTMPHGVVAMSRVIEGLVETSTNFAAIETKKGCCSTTVQLLTSQRSSIMSARDDIAAMVNAAITAAGGQARHFSHYPAWTPDPGSRLLATCKEVYRDLTGEEPRHAAIHAGLECGVIGDKIDGMEMVSFGPELEAVHTPEERLNIPSVEKVWAFLEKLLERL